MQYAPTLFLELVFFMTELSIFCANSSSLMSSIYISKRFFFNKTIEYRCTIVWFCFKNSTSREEIQNDISNSLKCLYILYTVCYGRKMASFWQWLPGVSLLLEQCTLLMWLSEPAWILDLVFMIMCSSKSSLFLYIRTNVGSWIKPIISGTMWNTSTCVWSNIMMYNKNN